MPFKPQGKLSERPASGLGEPGVSENSLWKDLEAKSPYVERSVAHLPEGTPGSDWAGLGLQTPRKAKPAEGKSQYLEDISFPSPVLPPVGSISLQP